jgi:hypothetical protein
MNDPDKVAPVAGPGQVSATPKISWRDSIAVGLFVVVALWVFSGLLADPHGLLLRDNPRDQSLFEWMFSHTAHALSRGHNPFVAPDLGTPTTANLAANTSLMLPSVVLAPVTLLFGPHVTFILFGIIALAGTATGWYFLLRSRLRVDRLPAAVAGLFCGFAPGMLTQANGHPQIAAQFFVPLILALVLRIGERDRRRPWLDGLLLGLAVAGQIMVGPEILAILSLALTGFAVLYFAQRPAELRERLRRGWLAAPVAVGAALVVTAYPLYLMFISPLAYHGIPNAMSQGDLASWLVYSTLSIAGDRLKWSPNPSEQSAFFGIPLIVVSVMALVWNWRTVWLRSAALTAIGLGVCSLGERIRLRGKDLGLPGPWALVADKPLFHDIIVTRLALVAIPVIGLVLAVTWHRSVHTLRGLTRLIWPALFISAILPTLPIRLPTSERPSVPAFIADGGWRQCVSPGGTLVGYSALSVRSVGVPQIRWQTAAGMGYRSPNGYYIAKGTDGRGRFGQPIRPIDRAIVTTIDRGTAVLPAPSVIKDDLAYWHADCVVIDQQVPHQEAVVANATAMFGLPRVEGGVWYWDVRGLRG